METNNTQFMPVIFLDDTDPLAGKHIKLSPIDSLEAAHIAARYALSTTQGAIGYSFKELISEASA